MASIAVSLTPTPLFSHNRHLPKTLFLSVNNHSLVFNRIPPRNSTLQKPRPLSLLCRFVPGPPPPAASPDELSGEDFSSSEEPSPVKTVFFVFLWASVSLALFAFSKDAKAAAADSIRASSLGVKVASALRSSGWPDEAVVFALATLPVIELRGAIPVGYWMKLSPILLTVLSILGNMVPVPLIVLYLKKFANFLAGKSGSLSRLLDMLFKSAKEKAGPIEEFQWLGLMLFVAVPFPGTGAWTGAIIASILDMPFWSAVSANFFGVVLAALLVNLGLKYAIVTGIILFLVSTFMWSALRSIRNWQAVEIAMKRETNRKQDEGTISAKTANCCCVISTPQTAKQDTYAPLVTALKSAAEDNAASFHFPGHNRGQAAPSPLTELIGKKPYAYDLPELPELGNLFSPEGPILDAQKQAAEVFGASETWFLTGGTTCGVQAAIMATCSPGDTLILPRNCHISAISGMVLSGATPKYIIPDYEFDWEIAGPVTPSQVNQAIIDLESEGRKPAAVFVTSPTYHGVCSNIGKISELCNSKDIPLIVDEAHGAHFGFYPELPFSALNQGADLAVQSTHKVLCSLTQSSMLHSSGGLVDRERISRCLQTLQSTSPSYLLLASLDAAAAQLAINSESVFKDAIHLASAAKFLIKQIPGLLVLESRTFSEVPAIDPLRVTVGVWELGLSGYEADEILSKDQGIMCELVGSRSITFVFTPGTREDHVKRLILGFKNLSASCGSHPGSDESMKHMEPLGCSKMQLNPREAFFARKRKASLEESIGKISGELVCPYPPGIPVLVPGEIVTRKALDYIMEIKRQGGVITGASDPLLSSIVICDS